MPAPADEIGQGNASGPIFSDPTIRLERHPPVAEGEQNAAVAQPATPVHQPQEEDNNESIDHPEPQGAVLALPPSIQHSPDDQGRISSLGGCLQSIVRHYSGETLELQKLVLDIIYGYLDHNPPIEICHVEKSSSHGQGTLLVACLLCPSPLWVPSFFFVKPNPVSKFGRHLIHDHFGITKRFYCIEPSCPKHFYPNGFSFSHDRNRHEKEQHKRHRNKSFKALSKKRMQKQPGNPSNHNNANGSFCSTINNATVPIASPSNTPSTSTASRQHRSYGSSSINSAALTSIRGFHPYAGSASGPPAFAQRPAPVSMPAHRSPIPLVNTERVENGVLNRSGVPFGNQHRPVISTTQQRTPQRPISNSIHLPDAQGAQGPSSNILGQEMNGSLGGDSVPGTSLS